MKKLVAFRDAYIKARVDYLKLKVALSGLESKLYYEWKQDNPKDRTAMDKVISELRLTNSDLASLTKQYEEVQINYEIIKIKYNFVMDLLNREDIDIKDIYQVL